MHYVMIALIALAADLAFALLVAAVIRGGQSEQSARIVPLPLESSTALQLNLFRQSATL